MPSIRANTMICLGIVGKELDSAQRKSVLVPAIGRLLRDPFAHSRVAAITALRDVGPGVLTPREYASKVLPLVSPLLLDPAQSVREIAFKLVRTIVNDLEVRCLGHCLRSFVITRPTSLLRRERAVAWSIRNGSERSRRRGSASSRMHPVGDTLGQLSKPSGPTPTDQASSPKPCHPSREACWDHPTPITRRIMRRRNPTGRQRQRQQQEQQQQQRLARGRWEHSRYHDHSPAARRVPHDSSNGHLSSSPPPPLRLHQRSVLLQRLRLHQRPVLLQRQRAAGTTTGATSGRASHRRARLWRNQRRPEIRLRP